ncbi:MAG: hypothetical protein HOQ34_01660 [Gemmatimonadaceae bacterium]|nr:hypothetical protein [Gemmatimonadaceae bacterium]
MAIAVIRREDAAQLLERIDPLRASPAAVALLEQAAGDEEWIRAETKGQREIMQRVEAVTVSDLTFWPLDVLLSLVNQLPEREQAPAAWERDLERGCRVA